MGPHNLNKNVSQKYTSLHVIKRDCMIIKQEYVFIITEQS